ncbi:MAG: hypothetical protein WAX69_25255 [Victivallales bacterium]
MRNIKLILFLLPLIMIFSCVCYFGVNIPYVDDWPFLNHLLSFKEGKETISDICLVSLWEHMMGTGFLLTLLSAMAVGYNFKYLLFLNVCILILGFLVLVRYALIEFNLSLKNIPFWFIPVPFLWFSWVQADNILTAIHSCLLISVVLSMLAFYFCYRYINADKTDNALILFMSMIASAILGSFSMINGLFVWPIVIFNVLRFTKNRTYKIAVISVFIVVLIVYMCMRPVLPHTSDSYIIKYLSEYARNPLYSLSYFISLFGLFANYNYYVMSAFVCLMSGSIMILAVASLTFLISCRRDLYKENIFLCSIIIYCLIIHSAIFYKNCQFYIGMPFFLSSRYASFNLLLVVSVYLLIVKIWGKSNVLSGKVNYLAIAIISICMLHYVVTPVTYIQPVTDKKTKTVYELLDYKNSDDQSFYTITINDKQHADAIREMLPLMEKYSISIFNKEYLRNEYPLEYALKFMTGEEIARLPLNAFEYSGKWNFIKKDCFESMPGSINIKLNPDYLVSSKSRLPNIGGIKSKSFMVSTDSFLYIQFMLSGNFKNRKIGLDLNNDGVPDVDCEPRLKPKLIKLLSRLFYVNPETPYCFDVLFDLSDYKGNEISLIVSDSGESEAEWMMFTQPVILKKIIGIHDK